MNTQPISCLIILFVSSCVLSLAGCLGSPEPYRPGYEERPEQVTLEDSVSEAERLALPVELRRSEAALVAAGKEIARVLGDVPHNPWRVYEQEMVDTLGPDLAKPHLGGRIPAYIKVGGAKGSGWN